MIQAPKHDSNKFFPPNIQCEPQKRKRVNLYFTITQVILGGFLHFMCQWQQKLIKLYTEQVWHVCNQYCGNGICSSGWQWPTAYYSAFQPRSNRLCRTFAESHPMFTFSFFVRVFLAESSVIKHLDSHRFWSKFYLQNLTYSDIPFLADVNLRSRSLYAIAHPSVVCLSVVCNVGAPYSAG